MANLPANLSPHLWTGQLDIAITFGSAGDGTLQVIRGERSSRSSVLTMLAATKYMFVSLAGVSFAVGS